MQRLTWEQRQNLKRAIRLNGARKLSELRSLVASVRAGQQFGCYSGYSP
jgi:hypothetical protein